ncbi:hypothetical protein LCGC14_0764340 [marine sediment metagenome]|uniref:Uncharacterized protein n=1 Tax=marine sediment metagenome TaxID=412755 RepID=A0A0F9Q4E7_9ZZZZ
MWIEFEENDAVEMLTSGFSLGSVLVGVIAEKGLNGSKEWEEAFSNGVQDHSFSNGVQDHSDDSARHALHGLTLICELMAKETKDDRLIKLSKKYAKFVDKRMEELDEEDFKEKNMGFGQSTERILSARRHKYA